MLPFAPSRTALTAAAARAAHPLVDSPPLIDVDPLAAALLGDRAEELIAYHRLHGDHPVLAGARLQVTCRARFAGARIREAVRAGVRQHVLLGAGLDSWAYRPDTDPAVTVFEVDHPATQRWKVDRLHAIGRALPATVRHVPADLEADPLPAALAAHGFRADQPAVVSWLGCTMYLTRAAIERTLRDVAGLAAGSRLVFDYLLPRELQDEAGRAYTDSVAAFSAEQGEPWLSQFAPAELADLATRCGLRVLADLSQQDAVEPELWTRTDALRPATLQRLTLAAP